MSDDRLTSQSESADAWDSAMLAETLDAQARPIEDLTFGGGVRLLFGVERMHTLDVYPPQISSGFRHTILTYCCGG
jgi:hypothetical protein